MKSYRELIIVVLLLALMSVLVGKLISDRRVKAALQNTLSNGRTIYMTIHLDGIGSEADWSLYDEFRFPSSKQFSSSTEYFGRLLRTGTLAEKYSLISAPGIPVFSGESSIQLSDKNVAWCITADISSDDAQMFTPYLFTRNILIANLSEDVSRRISCEAPFKNRGAVVIMASGVGVVASGTNGIIECFSRGFRGNIVLRP